MAVFTDPLDPKANSYVSLDRANEILEQRLYTDAWDNASESPGGRGYTVNDPGATLAPGDTTIPVTGGVGGFLATNRIGFANSTTNEYQVATDAPAPVSSIDIPAPGLLAPVPGDGVELFRFTPNEKESALIWATSVLDCYMDWNGTKTNLCDSQVLRWPRSGVVDDDGCSVDPYTIPADLESLTAETALYLLTRNLSKDPDLLGLGFSKAEIPGPIKVEVDRRMVIPMISNYLGMKAGYLGTLKGGAAGQGMWSVPLGRV
jgi:hypothetical protein